MITVILLFKHSIFPHMHQGQPIKRINQYLYDHTHLISHTTHANIYRGINAATSQPIAIKVINPSKHHSSISNNLITNYARALKTINHQSIVHVYDLLQTTNHFYVVMPLYGGTLAELMKKKKKFTQKQVFKLMKQMVDSLCYIGGKGIIHRQICPQNILENGQNFILSGFGFCVFDNSNNQQNLPHSLYDSPQVRQKGQYSEKSDIWSLGVMIIEMLSGKNPLQNKKYEEFIQQVTSLSIFSDLQISLDLKLILQKILRPSPAQRFSAQQIMQDFVQKNEGILEIESKKQFIIPRCVSKDQKYPINTNNYKNDPYQLKKSDNSQKQIQRKRSISSSRQKGIRVFMSPLNRETKLSDSKKIFHKQETPIIKIASNLYQSFLQDRAILQSGFKLKLLKLLQKLCQQQVSLEIGIKNQKKLKEDQYYVYCQNSIEKGNLVQFWHYLYFLGCMCLKSMAQTEDKDNQHRVMLMRNFLAMIPRPKYNKNEQKQNDEKNNNKGYNIDNAIIQN